MKADENFARVLSAFAGDRRVTQDKAKGFGSGALKTKGKIFAMVTSRGEFVVKISKPRVDEMVEAGHGARFDPGHGRLMKEWFVPKPGKLDAVALAKEALAFVSQAKGK